MKPFRLSNYLPSKVNILLRDYLWRDIAKRKIKSRNNNKTTTEIVFLSPASVRAIGGIKVIYKCAEFISQFGNDIHSSVYHLQKTKHRAKWFVSTCKINKGIYFDPEYDFFVVPEVWAYDICPHLIEQGFNYAIFVQNGYHVLDTEYSDKIVSKVENVYLNASFVLSISRDTSKLLNVLFPSISPNKIIRQYPSVGEIFQPKSKENIISYMPRKLPEHIRKICSLLTRVLPKSWKLVEINNMSEIETAEVFSISSIFLSTCDQEGFCLPPLEAAVSGALVVGYTGQAASEFFRRPNFEEVNNGDMQDFVSKVISSIKNIENGCLNTSEFKDGISFLKNNYSEYRQKDALKEFVNSVKHKKP